VVVEALQVEDSVDEVAEEFGLPGCAETAGLGESFVHADEDIAVESVADRRWEMGDGRGRGRGQRAGGRLSGFGIVEGDDVGGALVLEESLVEARHFRGGDKANCQVVALDSQKVMEEGFGNFTKVAQVQWARALAILNAEYGSGSPRVGGCELGGNRAAHGPS
jgi:hypothetical protein